MAVAKSRAQKLLPGEYQDADTVAALANEAMAIARFALDLLDSEWQPTAVGERAIDDWADALMQVSNIPKREAQRLAKDAMRQEGSTG